VTAERGEVEVLAVSCAETLCGVEMALGKLTGGTTYGVCEDCGQQPSTPAPRGQAGGALLQSTARRNTNFVSNPGGPARRAATPGPQSAHGGVDHRRPGRGGGARAHPSHQHLSIMFIGALIPSVHSHEVSHGAVARSRGRHGQRAGRLTLNPIKHMTFRDDHPSGFCWL